MKAALADGAAAQIAATKGIALKRVVFILNGQSKTPTANA
jgi:hypothetical protein